LALSRRAGGLADEGPVCLDRADRKIQAPLFVMHGDADDVVPQTFGRRLFAAAAEPKEGFWPLGIGHKDIFDNGGFRNALDFIERRFKP
jgi:fermentation-respiration switch protein FrsA (DUF1100 family)